MNELEILAAAEALANMRTDGYPTEADLEAAEDEIRANLQDTGRVW